MKLTKLEKLFDESDYGVSTATGSLSKILRGFWKEIGLTHLHINQLIDKWLEDPANEYEQDTTKINNSRGNIRKDNEKDDSTWKIFLRNLRMLRPKEVRFLIRLKFKNGATYRQVATMHPRSTNDYNSDEIFKELKWQFIDEDGFIQEDPVNYDDEGHRKDEPDYIPRSLCIFDATDEGFWYCSDADLHKHVKGLKDSEYEIDVIDTQSLFDSILPHVQETWDKEMANHLKRIANADPTYRIISHDNYITDGFHRIVRAQLMGIKELEVMRIKTLPELKFLPFSKIEGMRERVRKFS